MELPLALCTMLDVKICPWLAPEEGILGPAALEGVRAFARDGSFLPSPVHLKMSRADPHGRKWQHSTVASAQVLTFAETSLSSLVISQHVQYYFSSINEA